MKITVFTIAIDDDCGTRTEVFPSDATRDAWAWDNVVAKNINRVHLSLDDIRAKFRTAHDAIHFGECRRDVNTYAFGEHDIEMPMRKITLYTVQGDHFSNPGHVMKPFTDRIAATAEAVDLVNIMLADSGWQKLASPVQWEHHLERLQEEHGAQYCNVWIDESEIEVPDALPLDTTAREFIATLARCTTPEQEFEQGKAGHGFVDVSAYDDVSEYLGDFTGERLCDEYAAFMDFVRSAQELSAQIEVSTKAPTNGITVVLDGGVLQSVVSEGAAIGMHVQVVDYDIDSADPDKLFLVSQDGDCFEPAHGYETAVERSTIKIEPKSDGAA